MLSLSFRPFQPGDLAELQRIRAAAFGPVFASFRQLVGADIAGVALRDAEAEQEALLDRIAAPGAADRIVVAVLGDRLVGFASYTIGADGRVGELGLNAVDPANAGSGIGTTMYRHVLNLMRESGVEVATVGVGGDDSHAAARAAYAKAGFGPGIPSVYLYARL